MCYIFIAVNACETQTNVTCVSEVSNVLKCIQFVPNNVCKSPCNLSHQETHGSELHSRVKQQSVTHLLQTLPL